MNISSLLTTIDQPNRPALILPDGASVTFRELDEMTARLAAGLQKMGVQMGDRVVVLAPISLHLYAALIALFRLGAAAVFLDPQAGFRQLEGAATVADARAFIGSRKALWLKWLSPALRRIPITILADGHGTNSLWRLAQFADPLRDVAEVDAEAPALITFTGGSTDAGGPRAVSRTHRLLASQHAALSRALPIQSGDVDMPAFPVATLHNLAAVVPSVIPDFPFRRPQAVQPEKVLAQIKRHGVTTASGSPAYWWVIASDCAKRGVTLPLRRIVTGGAPVAPGLVERLKQVAPQAEILCVYGSTEAEPVAVISGEEILAETAALTARGAGIPLGHPVPDVDVRLLSEQFQEQPTGQVGEIWVSGEHVARNYFANPQADAHYKQRDAADRLWHRMGDLAYRDEHGRLWLVGRVHTIVRRADKVIYPVPVEALAATLPFIHRAALTGLPDPQLGQRTCLTVELAKDVSIPADWQAQLTALCAEHDWAIDQVRIIRKMPVDARHNARIDYKRLK